MSKISKYLKPIALSLMLVLIATTVSGCSLFGGSDETEAKVITIWGFDDEDVWKPIIKDAEKAVKGYEFVYVKKTLDKDYENSALNSILSSEGPDVWAIPSDWVYRHKDKLAPLSEKLIKDSEINLENDYVPAVEKIGVIDNQIYALTPTINTLMLYYNPKIFDAALDEYNSAHKGSDNSELRKVASSTLNNAPITWNEVVEATKLITLKNGNIITRSAIALGETNNIANPTDILYALMLQNGTEMTSSTIDLATFNLPGSSEPAKNALEFFTSFSTPGSANYTWNENMPNNLTAFSEDKVAMIIGYESLQNYFSQVFPNFKYKKATLPQIGDTQTNITDYTESISFVVPALTTDTESAWKTILSIMATSSSSYAATLNVSHAGKKSNFEPKLADREGDTSPGKEQAQTATTWTKGRFPVETDEIFNQLIGNKISGKQDSTAALDWGASQVTDLLRRETW